MKQILFSLLTSSLLATTYAASFEKGLTADFSSWLNANGYGSFGFERTDLEGGAFGGKSSASDVITH